MSWKKEVDELAARRAMAEKMGGAEKVARQHSRGKMDARARIAGLVDAGSFREIGKIAGRGSYGPDGELEDLAASNFIFGRANIDGRPVVASVSFVSGRRQRKDVWPRRPIGRSAIHGDVSESLTAGLRAPPASTARLAPPIDDGATSASASPPRGSAPGRRHDR